MQNPLAKQDRIEQDFDGRLYLIRKVSKSKDFSIDFGEDGRSRIQILQARFLRRFLGKKKVLNPFVSRLFPWLSSLYLS